VGIVVSLGVGSDTSKAQARPSLSLSLSLALFFTLKQTKKPKLFYSFYLMQLVDIFKISIDSGYVAFGFGFSSH
jgi:hypothetical protein